MLDNIINISRSCGWEVWPIFFFAVNYKFGLDKV